MNSQNNSQFIPAFRFDSLPHPDVSDGRVSIFVMILQRSDAQATELLLHFRFDSTEADFVFAEWFVGEILAENGPRRETIADGIV